MDLITRVKNEWCTIKCLKPCLDRNRILPGNDIYIFIQGHITLIAPYRLIPIGLNIFDQQIPTDAEINCNNISWCSIGWRIVGAAVLDREHQHRGATTSGGAPYTMKYSTPHHHHDVLKRFQIFLASLVAVMFFSPRLVEICSWYFHQGIGHELNSRKPSGVSRVGNWEGTIVIFWVHFAVI